MEIARQLVNQKEKKMKEKLKSEYTNKLAIDSNTEIFFGSFLFKNEIKFQHYFLP